MSSEFDIAVIGMAGRFPGADSVDEFWDNLINGVDSIRRLSEFELHDSGITESTRLKPNYVPASPVLKADPMAFDASFFGYSPREAQLMDPQHRLFLEEAWRAMEDAGYGLAPDVPVGVFGGAAMNTYFMANRLDGRFRTDYLPTLIGNDNSFLTTRVSYKLNLTGPSLGIQTACSTSLVAVHLACQSLLGRECDMALAGGTSVRVPHHVGYLHQQGSVMSPDGSCRPFSSDAAGTVFGSGAGVVVLKRYDEALDDRDNVLAVVKGTAVNNDGSQKLDFTAPSVSSQAQVIVEALGAADVSAGTIGYVEAHGTGTYLGDPIEVAALIQAFRSAGWDQSAPRCRLGSVKSNIGHLDAAAGIAGFIKAVLALKHRTLPATLHCEDTNPEIDFATSPFEVQTKQIDWQPMGDTPLRAGVTALGIGGTNAHAVLEEAPKPPNPGSSRRHQLLMCSARSEPALSRIEGELASAVEADETNLADVAHTLRVGRTTFEHRSICVASAPDEAAARLRDRPASWVRHGPGPERPSKPVLLFAGQGSQHAHMAQDLFVHEPVFRGHLEECLESLDQEIQADPEWGTDPRWSLRDVLLSGESERARADELLIQTALTQPGLFAVEYSLAQTLMDWGVVPSALLGHSIGELVAATMAGVMDLSAAAKLVALRGRLMQRLPHGSMLAVLATDNEIEGRLPEGVSVAVMNGASNLVLAGETLLIQGLQRELESDGVRCRELRTSHAFHSPMMDPILPEFEREVAKLRLSPPAIPIVSNVSGTWLSDSEAVSPNYWARHLRSTVQFHRCLETVLGDPEAVLVEVGPGTTLAGLARSHSARESQKVVSTMGSADDPVPGDAILMRALGEMWISGVTMDWTSVSGDETRRRVRLPGYPFSRTLHEFEPANPRVETAEAGQGVERGHARFSKPSWQREDLVTNVVPPEPGEKWLIIGAPGGVAESLMELAEGMSAEIQLVKPEQPFEAALAYGVPDRIFQLSIPRMERFQGLHRLVQALPLTAKTRLCALSVGLGDISGDENLDPSSALLVGPVLAIPTELPHVTASILDIASDDAMSSAAGHVADTMLRQSCLADGGGIFALRGRYVWKRHQIEISADDDEPTPVIEQRGSYVLTGGLGGIGLELARHLVMEWEACITLGTRQRFRSEEDWPPAVRQLRADGASITVCTADIRSNTGAKELLAAAGAAFGRVDGVFHLAGVVDDGLMQLKSVDRSLEVLAPKVAGTDALLEAAKETEAKFVALFSSVSALQGPAGQADYAAANAYLDATAVAQAGTTPRVVSINWPGWEAVGMVADSREHSIGDGDTLSVEEGLLALHDALALGLPNVEVRAGSRVRADSKGPPDDGDQRQSRVKGHTTSAILTNIWTDLLGVSPSPQDDFFALGGTSLIGIQVIAAIEEQFGLVLPLAALLESKTLSALTTRIGEAIRATSSNWSSLVQLRAGKSEEPPLFLVHGAGGTVLMYRELADTLGGDEPIYGVQCAGLEPAADPDRTIEEMATRFLTEIRHRFPNGPYRLAGYCMGGTIAFEMAHQLRLAGQEVGQLALLETYDWSQIGERSRWTEAGFQTQRILFHAHNVLRLDPAGRQRFLTEKTAVAKHRMQGITGALRGHRSTADSDASPQASTLWQINDDAAWAYQPPQIDVPILHILPEKDYRSYRQGRIDRFTTAKCTEIRLPVAPAGMLVAPFVNDLALALRPAKR